MKETDIQRFMVNINDSGWMDISAKDLPKLHKNLNEVLDGNINKVEIITESLSVLTYEVIKMDNNIAWKRRNVR